MAKDFETTPRGFKVFGSVTDEYGDELSLVESSAVGRPNVRLYAHQERPPERASYASCCTFDVEGAKKLIQALQSFVDDAEDEDNWRNDPDYIENFG